jgi:hypothetical protein
MSKYGPSDSAKEAEEVQDSKGNSAKDTNHDGFVADAVIVTVVH